MHKININIYIYAYLCIFQASIKGAAFSRPHTGPRRLRRGGACVGSYVASEESEDCEHCEDSVDPVDSVDSIDSVCSAYSVDSVDSAGA